MRLKLTHGGNFPFSMGDFQQPHLMYPNTLLFHWITKPFCPELSCPWDLSSLLYAFAPLDFHSLMHSLST